MPRVTNRSNLSHYPGTPILPIGVLAIFLLIVTLLTSLSILPQSTQKKTESLPLKDISAQLRELRSKLKTLEFKERASALRAEKAKLQANTIDTSIQRLELQQLSIVHRQLAFATAIDSLNKVRDVLTSQYRRTAKALFKRRILVPEKSFLLMPEEIRELALAEKMFSYFNRTQKKRAERIAGIIDSTKVVESRLMEEVQHHQTLLRKKRLRFEELVNRSHNESSSAKTLSAEKTKLLQFVKRKEEEARRIAQEISRQVQWSKKRESTVKKKKSTSLTPKKTTPEAKPQESIPQPSTEPHTVEREFSPTWPVSSHTIVAGYGERKNEETNTVTFNPGINIGTPSGSQVQAIESGIVSLVSWMPGYGMVVIIDHGKGWRSVYANMMSISVSEGSTVVKKGRIGKSGVAEDGEYLHFEIWKDQKRLNPLTYLK